MSSFTVVPNFWAILYSESLETFPEFETIKCIRHPANGGKADFVKGLKTYLI